MTHRSKTLRFTILFSTVLLSLYSCSGQDKPGQQTEATAKHDTSSDDASYHPFEDEPMQFDTVVQAGAAQYRLHVVYRSLNDSAVRQRVWYANNQGADTPGVFITSNREIEIAAFDASNRQLFDKKIHKKDLAPTDSLVLNQVLGAPEFVDVENDKFVFGAALGESDTDEGEWIEFDLTKDGKLTERSRTGLEE